MIKLKVIAGSSRPARFNTQPANWIYNLADRRDNIEVELLDLAQINLPLLDEPMPASYKQYTKDHTKRWSKIIDEADGFVFVTPEYNHSYSPTLKNAIDYLFFEWHYKPVGFISYGSMAGGTRAVEHLRAVAAEIRMYDIREQIMLPNYWENVDGEGRYMFTQRHEEAGDAMLDALHFWAVVMREARAVLNKKSDEINIPRTRFPLTS